MDLNLKKGLDIPISGGPAGPLQSLSAPKVIALSFDPFERIRFKLLVHVGDLVKRGQPLAESKKIPSQKFVSPAAGIVKEVRRGLKRRLLAIVIEIAEKEEDHLLTPLDIQQANKDEIIERLMEGGIFPHIRMRPFSLVADPKHLPRAIFVKALETAPFVPPAELQVEGNESDFQAGLDALCKITQGKVHLVYKRDSSCKAFTEAKGVDKHRAWGPHPIGNSSVHIHHIAPISHPEDIVWTLDIIGVIAVGKAVTKGIYHFERVVSITGDGIIPGRTGYFKTRAGIPIPSLISDRIQNVLLRFISGDPLIGIKVTADDFLGFFHTTFCVVPENTKRQAFHFLRLGLNKFTATRAYLSGFVSPPKGGYAFTTNQHGELRPFIDGRIYEKMMPMRIPTMQLVKAALADDFDLAQMLGLLEVDPEDFALPSFICPSKIDMMEIIKEGIHRHALEMGY